jgi:hypothetical protein
VDPLLQHLLFGQPEDYAPDASPPPDVPVYDSPVFLPPPDLSRLDRVALAFQDTPGFAPRPFESGGAAFLRGLTGGAAQGFAAGRIPGIQQRAALTTQENQRRQKVADANYQRALESWKETRADRRERARLDASGTKKAEPKVPEVTAGMIQQWNTDNPKNPVPLSWIGKPVVGSPLENYAPKLKPAGGLFGGSNALTPEALNMLGDFTLTTGQLPALGMSPTGRIAVANAAARRYPAANLGASRAEFQANQASLQNLQKMSDGVRAFENTAIRNSDIMLRAMAKIPDTNAPWTNMPIRMVNVKGMGSPEVAAFNAARQTVVPEFARILSNPTMAGQLSDEARKEVDSIISGNYSYRQMVAVIDRLKADAANRRTSYDQQIAEIKGRIVPAGRTPTPSLGVGQSEVWTRDANGNPVLVSK